MNRPHTSSPLRIRLANAQPVQPERSFVLYWMIAIRRPHHNFALDRAIAWAQQLGKGLVVLEGLRVGYPHASDRLHRFVIDGMAENQRAFASSPIRYLPYVEPEKNAGQGLLGTLASAACVVVTDEFPCFFLPRMVASAARQLEVCLEVVDSNGLLPLAAADRAFTAAFHFRRFVQRHLTTHLPAAPAADPLRGLGLPSPRLPAGLERRFPPATEALLNGDATALAALPIDHRVPAVARRGGTTAARRQLAEFVSQRLPRYHQQHNHPDAQITSGLSPYLHFGHLSAHEVFTAVVDREGWSTAQLRGKSPTGAREGWWGMSAAAEAFLDQVVVWRELSYNTAAMRPRDYNRFSSLPDWAQNTLLEHKSDLRPHLYNARQIEGAATHDPLFNAIQRELLRDGWFHNYMRILWGKKILEWSKSPQQALATMTYVMNRWSLDGRNPNAYAGYLWTLGRYDRPWPERPVFGKVRSMSSENTRRKVPLEAYLREHGEASV